MGASEVSSKVWESWNLENIVSPNSTLGIIATLVAKSWTLDDIFTSKILHLIQ